MKSLRLVLGDQLTHSLSALDGIDPKQDVVFMAEVAEEATYVPHHKQKIVFILSAMRHFAEELINEGLRLHYVRLDDPANTSSLTGELARAIELHQPDRLIATEPGEWRVAQMMDEWSAQFAVPLEIHEDDRFFCSRGRFARWADERKSYRMEFFYREMRRETRLLMHGDKPEGGEWNFDKENRKPLPSRLKPPKRRRFEPDTQTREVMALVGERFAHHFGDLEPFGWAVTRADALEALEQFISDCLPLYGYYQDAMKMGVTCMALFVPSELIEIGLERSLDMPKKRPTPEQIVTLLRQIEVATSQGKSVSIACREAGISDQSYYRWRKEYGGLDLDQARRMKDLEKENGRLKRLVADLSLEKQVLKDIASGNL